MNIRKGDVVKIITGKDKGKTGTVLKSYPQESRIVIEGLNLAVKHVRARKQGEKGQKLYIPGRISVSKVMVVCKACGMPTRIGHITTTTEGEKIKSRMCKKCKKAL